jgi:PPOX class probable F420-dependent enzyme
VDYLRLMLFDAATEQGRHALERLETAYAAWLTTVTPDGQPQSMPIWFTWDPESGDGGEIVVYGDHRAKRNRNLEANPRVSFHVADRDRGEDFVTVEGTARIDPGYPPVGENARYLAKYGETIDRHYGGPAQFGQTYSMPIRITPTRGRSAGG